MSHPFTLSKRLSRAMRNCFVHPLAILGRGVFRALPSGQKARTLPGPRPKSPAFSARTCRVLAGPYENLRRRKAELLVGTGCLFREMGRFSQARRHLERALWVHPCSRAAALDLAELLIREGKMTEAVKRMTDLSAICPGFGPAYLQKARALCRLGDIRRALTALEQAAALMPDCCQVHQELGLALVRFGRPDRARAHFETALTLDPDNASIKHLLDAAAQNASHRAPPDYVARLYDRYAAFFETQMAGPLNYTVPVLLKKRLHPYVRKNGRFSRFLDLGCGTGMTGACLEKLTQHRTGVDISRKMLLRAKTKAVYHNLVHMDIQGFLSGTTRRFDLAAAADVLIYFGDLSLLMKRVKACLKPGGLFAFSIESTREKSWRLRRTGRFAHHADHVREAAEKAAFRLLSNEKIGIRMENGQWVNGRLIILKA